VEWVAGLLVLLGGIGLVVVILNRATKSIFPQAGEAHIHAYLSTRYGLVPPGLRITWSPTNVMWARFKEPGTGQEKLLEFGFIALGSSFRLLSEKDL
jgi:hypothetical protein